MISRKSFMGAPATDSEDVEALILETNDIYHSVHSVYKAQACGYHRKEAIVILRWFLYNEEHECTSS